MHSELCASRFDGDAERLKTSKEMRVDVDVTSNIKNTVNMFPGHLPGHITTVGKYCTWTFVCQHKTKGKYCIWTCV